VINVATQTGETDHFTALDHIDVIDRQLGPAMLDAVLVNSNTASADAIGPGLEIDPVLPDSLERLDSRIRVLARDVISSQNPLRHDPEKLAAVLLELANGKWHDTSYTGGIQQTRVDRAFRRDLAVAGNARE
jgi:2-phospho-L-lactate transferase/gluconeogenesis factor (CofD/UPF0052 family)